MKNPDLGGSALTYLIKAAKDHLNRTYPQKTDKNDKKDDKGG